MHWYGGSIAEAVTLSKQKNAIFVVYVEGDSDLSIEMASTIDDTAVVSRLSNETNFLAVKLKSGTSDYTHFAQIYQFVPVPSLFFIGRNGTPLEVVCAGIQPTNLANRIDRILAEHQAPSPPKFPKPSPAAESKDFEVVCDGDVCVRRPKAADQPSTSQAPVIPTTPAVTPLTPVVTPATPAVTPLTPVVTPATPAVTPLTPVVTPATPAVTPLTPVVTPATPAVTPLTPVVTPATPAVTPLTPVVTPAKPVVTPATPAVTPETPVVTPATPVVTPTEVAPSVVPPATANQPEASTSDISVDEKLERAKELIEAKRREKTEQEKELERQKELERRNTGQGVAELKRWQADQEMKQIQEERKREKLENNLARQRILEQIAQDRAERKARDSPAAPPVPLPTPPAQQTTSHLPTSGDAGTSTRVQFKLPDGTSHTAHFDSSGTLGEVQQYLADNLKLSASSFALWTAFPRRELSAAGASLRSLQLAPSAALLVLPRAGGPPTAHKHYSSVYAFITQLLTTFIYQPSLVLYTWIRTRLFPPPGLTPRPPAAPAAPAGPPPRAGPLPRRRTNIHRLPGDSANDDDNNTWNGNSTQQM